ncbi:hypothetical protein ABW20_dc0101647 [Dactylellina cionopaga]|nr:hypothetical protein ABW20_dc0101647 [Dactylellina cionopaga]
MAKCSVIALYLRIFAGIRWFQNALYSILGLILVFFGLTFFLTIFQCRPIEAAFDFRIAMTRPTKCIVIKDFFYVSGSVNMLTDLLLVILPMPLAWKLGLDLRKRIFIILLFSLGILVWVASIVRITRLNELGGVDITCEHICVFISLRDASDFACLVSTTGGLIWSIIEADVALICASGPAIKPLVTHFFPHLSKDVTIHTLNSRPTENKGPYELNDQIDLEEGIGRPFRTNNEISDQPHVRNSAILTYEGQKVQPATDDISEGKGYRTRQSKDQPESTTASRTSNDTDSFSEGLNPFRLKPLSPPPAAGKSDPDIFEGHKSDLRVE